jgi:putative ABC transport system ATP-binding protein
VYENERAMNENEQQMIVHTRNLVKVYRSYEVEITALINVNIDIGENEYVAVAGPSGSGKSSLFKILGLLEGPDSGEVYFMNSEVGSLSENERTGLRRGKVGYVFRDINLVDELNVFENIELPLIYMKLSRRERHNLVDEVLEKYRIGHKSNMYPNKLTGLQQQIVALARATVYNPTLLLADEPTGNLDSSAGGEIMELISRLNEEGTTVVFFTNSMPEAQRAHRIIQLFDGHVVTEAIRMGV